MDAADIVEINQLLARYGHLIDAGSWERFDEVFVPDAVLDYRNCSMNVLDVLHGLDAVVAVFRAANHPSAHHCTNVYVYEDDGAVRVKSKWFVPYTRERHQPHRWYGGDYDDVVTRTEAGWRIQSRTCTARWQYTTDPEPLPAGRHTW
ncbi:MAG TPA: nuclear transport factor 2 family protein [Kribbellaceae bacterium]|jgi:3-phenylpropionate/cinnamic acid dioxygenase small subunit